MRALPVDCRALRGRLLGAAVLALLLLPIPGQASADFKPEDFDVRIEMGPDPNSNEPPRCESQPDGSMLCTNDFSVSAVGERARGTVTHRSSGLSGSIETVCDFSFANHSVMRMSPNSGGAPQIVELTGTGSQSCSWHMAFDGGSSLTGRIAGRMSMSLVDPATSTVRSIGRFDVDVVAGTGRFDQMVGSGSFGHEQEMPMNAPAGGPPPGEGPPSASSRYVARPGVSASGEGSAMNLKLRRGKATARIVSPGRRLKRSEGTRLHAVASPGASCKGQAAKGARKVDLGSAKAGRNGTALFRGAVAKRLGSGRWKLTVTCAAKRKQARARSFVTVG